MTCLLRYYPTRLLFAFISITFCFISRVHQVLCREDIVQFRLGQQTAFQDNFTYALTSFGTNFTDEDRVIADKLSQKLMEDENLKGSIDNNARDIAKVKFDELFEKELVEMVNNHFDFYQKINDDKDTRGYLKDRIFDMVYRKIKK